MGIGRPPTTEGLVRGDAPEARWVADVRVRVDDDGHLDFGRSAVYDPKGDRSIGLPWGTVAPAGTCEMFRAAKLRLVDVAPPLVRKAERGGRPGRSRAPHRRVWNAAVRPRAAPHLTWSHEL